MSLELVLIILSYLS